MMARFTVVALAAVLFASACGGGDSAGSAADGPGGSDATEPTYGGELVYGLEAANTGGWCIPEAQLAISGIQVARSIYDTLTVPNDQGEYVPFLAKSIGHDDDYTNWTIELRDGVTFHDGSKLTAEVVKNNLDAWRGEYPVRKPLLFQFVFNNISSVEVLDDLTLALTTATPWPALPAYLYYSDRVGIMAQAQLDDRDHCDSNLIGTGPFKLDKWVPGDHLSAKRNDDYWQTDAEGNQLPYLDSVEFRAFTEPTSRTNALLSGEIDALHTSIPTDVQTLTADAEQGDVKVVSSDDRAEVAHLMFNSSNPPFDNITARQAMAAAIDREEYRQVLALGQAPLASGPFAPGVMGYLEDTGMPEHDPERAKELVARYERETGREFEFTMTILADSDSQNNAQWIQQQIAKAGIDSTIRTVDQALEIDTALGEDWQMLNWRNHPGDDPDTQYVWWYGGLPTNFAKFDDPEINRLLDEGRVETDQDVRKGIYEDLNRYFAKSLYNLWLTWVSWTVATADDVEWGPNGIYGPDLPDGSKPAKGLAAGHPLTGMWISR